MSHKAPASAPLSRSVRARLEPIEQSGGRSCGERSSHAARTLTRGPSPAHTLSLYSSHEPVTRRSRDESAFGSVSALSAAGWLQAHRTAPHRTAPHRRQGRASGWWRERRQRGEASPSREGEGEGEERARAGRSSGELGARPLEANASTATAAHRLGSVRDQTGLTARRDGAKVVREGVAIVYMA